MIWDKKRLLSACPAVGQPGLDFLYSLAPWKGTGSFSIDKMASLMESLGNPQDSYKSIHVAGTNGKGSIVSALARILIKSGAKVGITISPHLERVTERIVVNDREIEESFLNALGLEIQRSCQQLGIEISFFEGITACAFLAFAYEGVDWAVVEVGLGGRLDATNVLKHPKACVIASIAIEHQEILGATEGEIAREKAGIIKEGAELIVGSLSPEAFDSVSEIAAGKGVRPFIAGRDFLWNAWNDSLGKVDFQFADIRLTFERQLQGDHQAHNLSLAAATALRMGIDRGAIENGLKETQWPARIENLRVGDREFLIDCAHNPAGTRALGNYLLKYLGERKVKIIFGALNTKDWKGMLEPLIPFAEEFIFLQPEAANPASIQSLLEFVSGIGIRGVNLGSNYDDAISYATGGIVVACGSIYMVGKLRGKLLKLQEISSF